MASDGNAATPRRRKRRGGKVSARRFEEILGTFYRWGYDEKGWSVNTRRQYVGRIRAADTWLGEHRSVSVIYASPKDLKAWMFSTAPVASSRNNIRQALVAFGKYLVEAGYVEVNAAATLPTLRVPPRIPKALPERMAQRIEVTTRTFDVKIRTLVLIYLYGGLRKSEARTLRWSDLDLDEGWFRFKGKGDAERAVPMHPLVREQLVLWRMACPSPEWVFPGRFGDKPVSATWVFDRVHEVGKAAGVYLHPHLMRHTLGTAFYNSTGGDIRATQQLLGHKRIETTALYARVWPADLQAAVRRLQYDAEVQLPDQVGLGRGDEEREDRTMVEGKEGRPQPGGSS
jgi:integrase/recombinase XerD